MKKNGYTIKELIIILSVFTVVYFSGVILVSHCFNYNQENDEYIAKLDLIKTQALLYAKDHTDEFNDNKLIIYANDLVKSNYLSADESGNVVDPRETTKNLNDLKIEITKNNDEYLVDFAV